MVDRSEVSKLIFSAITHYRRWLSMLIPTIIPEVDVSSQQLNVLYYVRAEDASMADIARVLGVAPTVITGLVDRLESRGLIRTDKGHEISQRVEREITARIEKQVGLLPPERQENLREGLKLFEQLTTELEGQEELSADTKGFSVG